MKIGPRITLATAVLLILGLGLYGVAAMHSGRAELEADLARQTVDLAMTIAAALEAEAEIGPGGDPLAMAQRLGNRPGGTRLEVVRFDTYANPMTAPDTRERARRVQIQARSSSEFVSGTPARPPFFALTFPVWRQGRVVGVLELTRDTAFIGENLRATTWRLVVALGLLVAGLTLAIAVMTRATISRPLGRMLAEISEVAKGDLSRTVFAARSDEVGQFAARFNEMTASLREARAEAQRSIDARLTLEARLRQSETLATIGQLAAEIAHEVGTPLNVIGGRARTLDKKSADPEEVARNASIIAAQCSRISKIIQRLLDFARRGRVAPTRIPVDLNRVVGEALEFLEYQIERSQVRAHFSPMPGVEHVPGDPDAIQQVCLNLIVNAVQAMPSGGDLYVSTGPLTRRKEGLEAAAPTRYACLEVSDTGGGFSDEDRARLFEPFYSTKKEGSGLGLAVSHGIVKDHDGWIELEPRAQGGTTLRVFLPAPMEIASVSRAQM